MTKIIDTLIIILCVTIGCSNHNNEYPFGNAIESKYPVSHTAILDTVLLRTFIDFKNNIESYNDSYYIGDMYNIFIFQEDNECHVFIVSDNGTPANNVLGGFEHEGKWISIIGKYNDKCISRFIQLDALTSDTPRFNYWDIIHSPISLHITWSQKNGWETHDNCVDY